MATLVGVAFGVLAARFHRSRLDYGVMFIAVAGLSIPNYVLGLFLILLFAVKLSWLPAFGVTTPLGYLLPTFTIAAAGAATIARQTRAAMLEVLGADYVRTARSKGLAEPIILWRHALRNALLPVITSMGLIFGQLLGGAVIVESVFGIPGLGKLTVDSIALRDYPSVQGAVLVVAFGYVFVNILVDVAYVAIDTRVRLT
jgi:ABC-type dipeptide/oligopeptide/nickel transport system permease component